MNAPSRPMRRRDRVLSTEEAWAILDRAEWGVLATVGEDGWPYAVPMNHARVGSALVLHSATEGHKLDNLAAQSRVSYCVVTQSEVLPAELATRYESAIAFGRATPVCDPEEKRAALQVLGRRFAPGFPETVHLEIEKDLFRTEVIRIEIERITGKARR